MTGFHPVQHVSILAVMAACLFSSCRSKEQILFHAGVGQRSSLNEIRDLFSARHPRTQVNFSYKGSGYFIADITRSREGDLFMPGEEFYLLQAAERGLISGYAPANDIAAHFVTVILTPRGNPKRVSRIADFAKPGVRVGLGNPRACAIGLWHEKTFRKAGIWEAVRKNATMSAKCIPELGNAAQHRLIDATIVWASTAVLYLRDCEIIPIEPEYRGVVRLPVAVLSVAKNPAGAQQLKRFILSSKGRKVFSSHAYAVGSVPRDSEGFQRKQHAPTELLMQRLKNAASAVKNATVKARELGPLIKEVRRQRKTTRSGS